MKDSFLVIHMAPAGLYTCEKLDCHVEVLSLGVGLGVVAIFVVDGRNNSAYAPIRSDGG